MPGSGPLPFLQLYLRPAFSRVLLLFVLVLVGIATQLVAPQLIRQFIDQTQASGASQATLMLALGYVLLTLVQRSTLLATVYVGEDLGWRATNQLRHDLTQHVLRLDMGFHKLHTPGELIERIDGDCDSLRNLLSQFGVRVVSNLLLVIGILLLVSREDWRVGVGLATYAVLVFLALALLQRLAVRQWGALRAVATETSSFLEEHMAATETIRSAGAERYTLAQLEQLSQRQLVARRQADVTSNLAYASTNFLFLIGYALGLGIGASLYLNGQASIGTAFLLVLYIGMLATPLEELRHQAQDLQQAVASLERIAQLRQEQPRLVDAGTSTLPPGALAMRFADVTFAYNDAGNGTTESASQSNVLHKVAFDLPAGHRLGLLGRTGSGKSTLARLVARLYDPDSGQITLAGTELSSIRLTNLRERIGVVTQDVQIFQASIRENLRLFRTDVSDTAIQDALAELGLLEWVQQLPAGLDTMLGPGGLGLSAGELQLLAFARIFLRDPGLIILDEASSRLDPTTEHMLEQAITRLLAGRTAIIIAHRLATLQRTDTILILEQGQVLEYGPRALLAADSDSRYAALLRTGMNEVLV